MKSFLVMVAMILACAGTSRAEEAKTVVLPAKPGNVTFEHKTHVNVQNSCKACHTTEQGGKIEGLNKEMAHDICTGCHKKGASGPTTCSGCHKKE
jgi:predicted CXXCH cytochrome family protein